MFKFKQYDWRRYNISLLIVVIILCIFSAYFVKFAVGADDGGSYFKRQIIAMIIGICIAVFVSLIDYHFLCDFVIIYYIIGTLMVAATKLTPLGTDLDTDSYRWLKLPGVNFQPSEICKIIVILTLAVFLTQVRENLDKFRYFLLAGLITAIPTFFILIQSDLSSGMVMVFIFAMMIFSAGLSYKIVIPILSTSIPAFIAFFWYIQQPFQKILKNYQLQRIIGFLHPEDYANSTMYQQNHSVQSIASGRLYGKLISDTASASRSYHWVDVCESDFIFTVIGEEVGFIGSCLIIGLLLVVIIKCLLTARKAGDTLGQLIAVGISAMIMFQVFANIGVATRILPNTGLPLPFLSNGISSMIGCMIGMGLILNIGIQSRNITRGNTTFF